MGTWGVQPFENDDAADWAFELEGVADWGVVSDALTVAAAASPSELDSDAAATAIAAAEVVARGRGRETSPVSSKEVGAFLARVSSPPAEVVALAVSALAAATSADGELAELWDGDPDWLAENDRLRAALTTD